MARANFSKIFLCLGIFFCNTVICMQSVHDNGVFFEKNTSTNLGVSVTAVSSKSIEIDTSEITEILNHTNCCDADDAKNSLVIFDIDGVVMIPQQLLGNDPWAYYEGDKYIAKFNNGIAKGASKEAFKKGMDEFNPVWSFVQKNVEVKLVDSRLKNVLGKLKESFIKVMGFTARGRNLADRTKYQMDSVGIDFSKSAYGKENTEIGENIESQDLVSDDYIYKNGVLSVDIGVNKGEKLEKFFNKIGKKPRKIIFIDDQPKNIKTIKDMCEKDKISFVGIRYGGADNIVKLDEKKKQICDFQLQYLKDFGVVLSDEDAVKEIKLGYAKTLTDKVLVD